MAGEQLTRDAALRIGLAARVLPDTESSVLMKVLVGALGLPLTEEKLTRLTVRELASAGDGALGNTPLPALKKALDFLWGKTGVDVADDTLPQSVPYESGDMPESVRVAVASNGGELLDGHFGSCTRFLVYQVSPDELRLIDVRTTAGAATTGEDKNAERAALIADCDVLYIVSIGGPAAAKVVKKDVHPVKFPNGGEAREVLAEMQRVLKDGPPPWLAKVMGRDAEARVRFEREEAEA
jgi:nitrogen fixation protein NifX